MSQAFSRLDRNIIYNFSSIDGTLSDRKDRHLAKRLIGLLAFAWDNHVFNENVFGEKILEPTRIASIFSYAPNYLTSAHLKPKFFDQKTEEEIKQMWDADMLAGSKKRADINATKAEPAWYTNIDNALYVLRYMNIPLVEKGRAYHASNAPYSELKRLEVFKTLRKYYLNGTRKAIYEYRESDAFINNLGRWYLFFDFNVFRQLTDQEINVYLSLLRFRSSELGRAQTILKTNKGTGLTLDYFPTVTVSTYSIDLLAKIWGLEKQKSNTKSKFSIEKDAISKVVSSINEKAGYTFCNLKWVRARTTDNFPGQPIMEFPYGDDEKQVLAIDATSKADKFNIHYLQERFRVFYSKPFLNEDDFRKRFVDYLFKENIDWEGKVKAVNSVSLLLFGKDLDDYAYSKAPHTVKKYIDISQHNKPLVELHSFKEKKVKGVLGKVDEARSEV